MNENTKLNGWRVILEAFLMAAFASIISILVGYILKSDILVNVTTPLQSEDQFITAIDIKNLSTTNSETSLQMFLIGGTQISDIQIDKTNVQLQSSSALEFESIAPNSSVCFILKSDNPITEENFRISSDSRVTINFLANQKHFSASLVVTSVVNFVILFASYGVTVYISEKRWNKRIQERTDLEYSRQKIMDTLTAEVERTKKDVEKTVHVQQETQLFYAARFSDYAKELSFWKDTIRRLLYTFGESRKEVDKFFDIITDNLKSYLTKTVDDQNYDSITYIAQRISNMQNRDNKEND